MKTEMTLRDQFAEKAMLVATITLMHSYMRDDADWCWDSEIDDKLLADRAYEIADAMIRARDKK